MLQGSAPVVRGLSLGTGRCLRAVRCRLSWSRGFGIVRGLPFGPTGEKADKPNSRGLGNAAWQRIVFELAAGLPGPPIRWTDRPSGNCWLNAASYFPRLEQREERDASRVSEDYRAPSGRTDKDRRLSMHFKRKGPKSTRSGCLMCKPHKRQGTKRSDRQRHSVNRRLVDCQQQGA